MPPRPSGGARPRAGRTRRSPASTCDVILALVGLVALLWIRWPIPLYGLKALELGMIGLLAGRFAFVEYRMMLEFSQRGETMMAR